MPIAISAAVQTGNRVAVTVSGLNSSAPAVATLTLFRDDLTAERSEVRGYVGYDPTADGFVAYDHEAPLARPVFYTLQINRVDGTTVEMTTAVAVVLTAAYPIVSEPITGRQTALSAIVQWPTLERSGKGSVIEVVDREDPIVVSGGLSSGSSVPVLRTDTLVMRQALWALLEESQVLQIRDPHPDVEDVHVAVRKVSATRLTNDPADVRRMFTLDAAHVSPPALGVLAQGDTLLLLSTKFPGTLLSVSTYFPGTLLDIAARDLATV